MPRRRCVGCERIAPKIELVRIALALEDDGSGRRAVCDRDATMPGRGAYLCRGEDSGTPDLSCLDRAIRRGGFARALRSQAKLDRELVELTDR